MPRKPRHSVTQPSDPSYRLIPLTQRQTTKVSTEDFEHLSKFSWQAWWNKKTQTYYAKRCQWGYPKETIYMHRTIVLNILGIKTSRVDHENKDTLDNRRENLRPCTPSQNNCNKKKRKNISGFTGVRPSCNGKMWQAFIGYNKKTIILGQYTTKEEAALVYDEAAKRIHGKFATLNFPTVS